MKKGDTLLDIKNMSFSYGERIILDDVDLSLSWVPSWQSWADPAWVRQPAKTHRRPFNAPEGDGDICRSEGRYFRFSSPLQN